VVLGAGLELVRDVFRGGLYFVGAQGLEEVALYSGYADVRSEELVGGAG
jgi:glutamine amidotransferase-like uncharacterized protein